MYCTLSLSSGGHKGNYLILWDIEAITESYYSNCPYVWLKKESIWLEVRVLNVKWAKVIYKQDFCKASAPRCCCDLHFSDHCFLRLKGGLFPLPREPNICERLWGSCDVEGPHFFVLWGEKMEHKFRKRVLCYVWMAHCCATLALRDTQAVTHRKISLRS